MNPRCRAVAYLHHTFPSLTATFVYREMREVRRRGVQIINIACKKPSPERVHAEATDLVDETLYVPGLGGLGLYLGMLVSWVRRPIRFCKLAWQVWSRQRRRPGRWRTLRSLAEIVRAGYLARRLATMPHVVHLHTPFSTEIATIGWMASRLRGLPFSFTNHTPFDAQMIAEKLRDASFAVSISRFDRERLLEEGDPDAETPIHVIHCGVPAVPSAGMDERDMPPLILSVGSLIEKKGHAYLIEACDLLKRSGTAFKCRIVGDGPLAEALSHRIANLGLDDCVKLMGPQDQQTVQSLYQRASLFVLASVEAENGDIDGVPVVLMEAMAAGVPCVSTRVAGIPELIESPSEGILVEQKDVGALADGIMKLLGDASLREQTARAALAKVQREFSLEKSATQLAALLKGELSPSVQHSPAVVYEEAIGGGDSDAG